jgi:GNAT superfamily N-acetyltransferase
LPIYRPSTVLDLDMVLACRVTEPISWVTPDRYQQELASGSYRPEWTWLAEDEGELVGRAVWWAPAGRESPVALDCLWVAADVADRTAVATALLQAGHAGLQDGDAEKPPDYEVDLDPRWRDRSDIEAAFAWRQEAARGAGLTHTLERLSFAWTPQDGIPDQSHRLRFTTESADEVFLQAFARVAEGSLDDLTRRNVAALGAQAQARDDLDFYVGLPGERSWWRLAHTAEGEFVGLAIPSRSAYNASVSYLGVVPTHRGHGYVDDLLAEITRQHADHGAPQITGTTDTTNAPMVAAFTRGGYTCIGVRMVLSATA